MASDGARPHRKLTPWELGVCGEGPIRNLPRQDPADFALVETTPATDAAGNVFSANELNARLEAMAEIVEAEEPDDDVRGQCWGCGKTPPIVRTHIAHPSKTPGWVVRPQKHSVRFRSPEVWCPECAAMPGFGSVEEPE